MTLPAPLADRVRALGSARVLLGLDFDGVLAPIVPRREDARALPGTIEAVRRLADPSGAGRSEDGGGGVAVALVSGRGLGDLASVSGTGPAEGITLVGSHGAEAALRPGLAARVPSHALTQEQRELLGRVAGELERIAAVPGAEIELKPTAAVLHTRRSSPAVAAAVTAEALAGPGSWLGVHVTPGKSVVEIAVVETSKGVAVQRLRAAEGAEIVIYVGDDVTDETVFATMGPGDIGVKVGPGDTHAAYRLDGPADVLELLELLAQTL